MRVVCIIPARWGSTRFPGKPLAPIRGVTDLEQPLILRTVARAQRADCFDSIYVATDDIRISSAVVGSGANPIMTSPVHLNGTERCAEAAAILGLAPDDIVVNLQGDSVLTPAVWLRAIVTSMQHSPSIPVWTCIFPRRRFDPPAPGDVEALVNKDFWALYFTRGQIPLSDDGRYQHFGVYGYRVGVLRQYATWEPTSREIAESLEQLRFLEHGISIRCIQKPGDSELFPKREVNYPDDIAVVEEVMRKWGIV